MVVASRAGHVDRHRQLSTHAISRDLRTARNARVEVCACGEVALVRRRYASIVAEGNTPLLTGPGPRRIAIRLRDNALDNVFGYPGVHRVVDAECLHVSDALISDAFTRMVTDLDVSRLVRESAEELHDVVPVDRRV